ncbi:cytochrome [Streptomyces sp. NRRL F-4489]|uniref:cytochrome P450 n=1 Tax=Streptomyces sp. NRRL F-4489 TaxID=1609095 RepID=UPI000749293B|nr:cytochrome P450 [Streptomyces sp. NRRL F-4489]KUL55515.1 cytochrome [Streptomyces sp. NRRL F-4489]
MGIGDRRRLRRDQLGYIEKLRRRSTTGLIRLPWGAWCVSDTDLAQTLLRDPEYNTGKSGFFGELLPTRGAQVEVGHAVRNLVRAGMPHYRAALAKSTAELPAVSRWPAAGTRLVYGGLADLLLHPGAPVATRRLMHQAAVGGVALRAPHVWQRARAEVVRSRLVAAVTEEARRRREHRIGEPRDVLDAVLAVCPPHQVADRTAAELHLMLFRAIMAPISSSLAWCVLLACLSHPAPSPWPWSPDHVVREALRHRPVAWMLGRTIPRPVAFGGIAFQPGELLSVSPYLLHHDERHWPAPHAFRPERWAEKGDHGPYIPFGMGPFSCAGAAVAHTLLTESLTALTHNARLTVTGGDTRAAMSEGNVPRPFILHRVHCRPTAHDRGRG